MVINLHYLRKYFLLVLLTAACSVQASPDIQHWTTSKGARVYYVQASELPILDIRVVFDAGSARDGDKPGLAALTNSMFDEGAGNWNADQIADRFDGVGAEYSSDSLRDMAILSLRSVTDTSLLEPALSTFTQILTQPTFPADSLERIRKNMLVGLQQQRESPGDIASKAFYAALYGTHPYAMPPEGTEESVAKVKRADVLAFYKQYYVASNAVIALVGDVNRSEAEKIAERLTTGLDGGHPAKAIADPAAIAKASMQHIKHPSAQSHILMGHPGMRRGDKDYFALYVGNHALGGGGLVSKLSDEIREKRGLSYSVYSYFSPMRVEGPFTMGLQTRNDQVGEALEVMQKTLRDYIDKGITKKQLQASKKNIIGGFPLRIDSNKKIVEYLAMIGFYNLPLDHLKTFTSKVEAVTVKDIRDAFKRRVHPDAMVTIVVGNGKELGKNSKK